MVQPGCDLTPLGDPHLRDRCFPTQEEEGGPLGTASRWWGVDIGHLCSGPLCSGALSISGLRPLWQLGVPSPWLDTAQWEPYK